MTREEAIQWLKVINTKEFGWDEFALQESQREIRERCEQGVREAIDMAIEALSADRELAELKPKFESAVPNCQKCAIKELWKATEKEDLVAAVRCKDCRHRDLFSCPLADNDFQKDDDFCSWGERSEK